MGRNEEKRASQRIGRRKQDVTNEDSWASVKKGSSNIYTQRDKRRGMLTNASGEEGEALVYFRRPFTPPRIVIIAEGEKMRYFSGSGIFRGR